MKTYRLTALFLTASFAAVGLLFLSYPDGVISFFNRLSEPLGMARVPLPGYPFFLILASAYMALVALLAWEMFRHPENQTFPRLLIQGKLASSLISIGFFVVHKPFLIYLVNFVVDGLIALGVWLVSRGRRQGAR